MEVIRITSAANPLAAMARSLNDRKGRKEHGRFLIEGVRTIGEAFDAGVGIETLFLSEEQFGPIDGSSGEIAGLSCQTGRANEPAGLPGIHGGRDGRPFDLSTVGRVVVVPDSLLRRISDTESPQGMLAVAATPAADWRGTALPNGLCLVLERVSDPGNVGTIIRTADACGFDAVFLACGSADPYSPKVIRSAMGSMFHLPVSVVPDGEEEMLLEWLRSKAISLCAAAPRAEAALWETGLAHAAALMIGNEANGLSERFFRLADRRISIPMPGRAESLNASVAAAALMVESVRQRAKSPDRNICP